MKTRLVKIGAEGKLIWLIKSFYSRFCQIKYVSARDAGTYECQVSTVPKMSRRLELLVVVPKVG